MSSLNILTVDLSYRDTGVCFSCFKDDILTINSVSSLKNPKMEYGFDGLNKMALNMQKTVNELYSIKLLVNPDIIIVEMPCFTQDARSALCIGCCWGSIRNTNAVFVEPSLLKKWSNSKRGDSKAEVKRKVMNRVILSKKDSSNDNIVDAVGLSLCFVDMLKSL